MITVPAGVRIHLALGATDMRKGFDGLGLLVQEVLRADPFSGHLFVFPRQARVHAQDPVQRRQRHVPVQ